MQDHRQIQFLRQPQLPTEHLFLLLLIRLVPIIIQSDLSDCHQFMAVLPNCLFHKCQLALPILFDIFGMQPERRIAIFGMRMAYLQNCLYRRHIDARHNHGFYSTLALASDHLFTIRSKCFFINMDMGINHN